MTWRHLRALSLGAACLAGAFGPSDARGAWQDSRVAASTPPGPREEAHRANNVGIALLEQFSFEQAAATFRRALQIEPNLPQARHNLSVALLHLPDLDGAAREARAAAVLLPGSPGPYYVLGLILKAQSRTGEALAAFERVRQIDPRDVGANVNVGQLLFERGRYGSAVAAFRAALASDPSNSTAAYNLSLALTRSGRVEEGHQAVARFQALRESGASTALGNRYREQGRYAEAIAATGVEPELVDRRTPDVTFVAAAGAFPRVARKTAPGDRLRDGGAAAAGGLTLVDVDGDGDLDLLEVAASAERLWRNDRGRFADVTARAGLRRLAGAPDVGMGAVAGDYDNDGRPDLFVLRQGASALYRNQGGGRFRDVTAGARLPPFPDLAVAAAFVDADHDGDLDLFVPGFVRSGGAPSGSARAAVVPETQAPAPHRLLRNNGNGTFTDITSRTGLLQSRERAVAVVPTDYDNHRDVDLLVVNYGARPALFANLRDGSFRDVGTEAGLPDAARFTSVAAGDVDKDGYVDFYFGKADGPGIFVIGDGRGGFAGAPAPEVTAGTAAAQFLDYDNDGVLDLVVFTGGRICLLRNVGGRWTDVSDRAFPAQPGTSGFRLASARSLVSGDLDGDGDTDIVVRTSDGGLTLWRNEGGNRNGSLAVGLTATVSNRSGAGAKVEMLAGSLRQELETAAATPAPRPADVVFGLGRRAGADVVRVLWPAGILQAQVQGSPAGRVRVTELDRQPSSCPYLFAWNGERFGFVTDFLGAGEFGYWVAPGVRNTPDPDERVRLRADQLVPRAGRYEIRITNELEETLYLDRLRLDVVAHSRDVAVFPDEGVRREPRPAAGFYVVHGARPARAVVDEHGHDVLARVARLDRRAPDDFAVQPLRGYAETHSLTIDLGPAVPERAVLLLTGWTDYAFSSDNVAAHQSGLKLMPPILQVRSPDGEWRTVVHDVGVPAGRPQTVVVDLTGRLGRPARELRLVTNMRIYWDRILVGAASEEASLRPTTLDPVAADLRWRGFSAETAPDGRPPLLYDYDRVSLQSSWKVMTGRYTREGDVRELLSATDDLFVVARPGDELAVAFDAERLAPLAAGWTRTFLLSADGFSKEMDVNSASPDAVGPLPSHGTSGRRLAWLQDRYNTRVVRGPFPRIETLLLDR